ncbi:hypothetical protein DSCW_32860 [Desulfosarcina widdelii]|uniref:FecR protein domain-containing protein n=1 Tax=Desulfosarcina widdelii TaxID=947919 RepID=A0A5K7Z6N9_9BACT|nr:FecR domain-containing protein [Desulfosarcina widdelii]BBO75869.1 hypothetical protein DSCW_32860 [Desulfosarcina widdelii]
MQGVTSNSKLVLFSIFLTLLFSSFAWAAGSDCDPPAATAVSVQGVVQFRSTGGDAWQAVKLNDTFCPGDEIRVQDNSRASLALANESVLRLNANSSIVVQKFEEKTSFVDVFKGAAHLFARKPNKLEVNTPYVVAGVRGTEFLIRVEDDQTFLSVFEGGVLASNDAGEVTLTSGQSAVAQKGRAPVLTTVVRPRDAVQWALYYPPVVYVPPGQPEMREDLNDPVFLANRASQALAVGEIDAAEADLDRALAIDPASADALSLQAIVALVRNDKEKALALAQQAVEANPKSATALVAKSYAQQVRFDLEGARKSLMDAVAASPDDALAHARLAEIHLSFGNLDKALQSAQKAAAIAPGLSRTQTVLGFAYLTQVKTDEARAAFDQAIQADQADPLPRLGLGLAKIREGQLEAGRMDLEVAASLDPNSSLIRSYLGKAYYEEKRGGLDEREYKTAKELDPNDPTPWFYSAIAKQTTNRPVEALQDFETAKELNDNRAVYRSKLLLDSDLAARSAATARIYNDLGFGQRGLLEGYNAVNADPTNFSAHRFLADTYATLPRHEIARVSELLQSQLLQPTNTTPIQPGLAESNLFLISAQGAAQTSFNEFNPLFARDGATLQASGLYGSNETWGGEGVASGIYGKISLSAGYTHYETDGWRENSDQKDDIANIFAQYEISDKTSIQAEYRYRDNERGDIRQRFFQEDFLTDQRTEVTTNSARVGLRHAFSPGSIVLGNFQYAKKDDDFFDVFFYDFGFPPPLVELNFENPQESEDYAGELSYLFRSKTIDLVSGVGYVKKNEDVTFAGTFQWPGTDPPTFIDSFSDPLEYEVDHVNLYAYSYFRPLEGFIFSVGASGDFYNDDEQNYGEEEIEESQFNPKLGVSWNPFSSTTIRGAVFRTFKRTLVTEQTLEPTQVAGFNQFFDDPEATDAWVYGVALDQKLPKDVYFGMELSYRDLSVPFYGLANTLEEASWEEYLGRAYLYWTPHEWLALKAEYLYEDFERDEGFTDGVKDMRTHRFPLGINFFHPSGLSAGLTATYYDQKGTIERTVIDFGVFEDGADQFWLVDAAISYRFPNRYGFATLGVKNLFDEEFDYYEVDRNNLTIQQDMQIYVKLTLTLP